MVRFKRPGESTFINPELAIFTAMKGEAVNINFLKMAIAFRAHVRHKAMKVGNNIIYVQNGQLIEENPKDSSKIIKSKSLASR